MQTNGRDEISYKYLDFAFADEDEWGSSSWYNPPAASNIILSWETPNTVWCLWSVPCYKQTYKNYNIPNWTNCSTGCVPVAIGIIFWYHA